MRYISCVRYSTLLVALVLCVHTSRAQPDFSIQGGTFNLGWSWCHIGVEATIVKFDSQSVSQSLRIAASYGPPYLNATFVPIELRYILFHGSDHIDVVAGLLTQVAWEPDDPDDMTNWLTSSLFNPGGMLGYRYEKESGGFVFRIGVGCAYVISDRAILPSVVMDFGHSF